MTFQALLNKLVDLECRCAEITLEGEDAVELANQLMELPKQPQILPEHYTLLCKYKKVVFLPTKLKPCTEVNPRGGDIVIGYLCGRIALIPKEVFE